MPTKPKRIQRTRSAGWKMPEGAVYVGRPTKYGNPHRVDDYLEPVRLDIGWPMLKCFDSGLRRVAAGRCVGDYASDLLAGLLKITVEDVRRELAGKDLVCWCPLNAPCHADVLLMIARGEKHA